MAALDSLAWFHAEDAAEWRAWLADHHARSPGVWLVTWRKASGKPVLAYDDAVAQALAFGWIDSKPGKIDEHRTRLLMTPRKPGTNWSRPNQRRVLALEAAGLMAPAGASVVASARADGSWSRLDAVEDLVIPDDLAAAFERHPGSRARWEGFPRSAKRGILEWILNAKRPETRATRLEQTASLAAVGQRANAWPRR